MNFSPSFSLFVRVAPFLALGLLGISSSAAGCASNRGDNVTSESLDENGYGGYGGGYGGYGGGAGGGYGGGAGGGYGGGGGEGNAAGGGGSAIGPNEDAGRGGNDTTPGDSGGGGSGCSASSRGFSSGAPLLGLAALGIAAALRRRRERGAP